MIDHQGLGVVGYAIMGKRKPRSAEATTAGDRLSIRLDLASGARIGPGKVAVLEEIGRSGSISAAGRAVLTPAGKAVIERYRAIEMDTALAARKHLLAINRACASK